MSVFSNNDNFASKPKFPRERQVRKVVTLTVNGVVANGNTIVFVGVGALAAANVGVVANLFVYDVASNVSNHGSKPTSFDYFVSNNYVVSVTGNTVVLAQNVSGVIADQSTVDFCTPITYTAGRAAGSYANDTVLITDTRSFNANTASANSGDFSVGWVNVRKKVNNDGTVRFIKETLVCLTQSTAQNLSSANTSTNNIASGL